MSGTKTSAVYARVDSQLKKEAEQILAKLQYKFFTAR